MQVVLLFVRLCCSFDEALILPLLQHCPAASSQAMQDLLEEHHVFGALAHVHQQRGQRGEARRCLLLHARTALLDLRACACGVLPFLVCAEDCAGGQQSCAVAQAMAHLLGAEAGAGEGGEGESEAALAQRVGWEMMERLEAGAQLRRKAVNALQDVRSQLHGGATRSPGAQQRSDQADEQDGATVQLLLSLMAEAAVASFALDSCDDDCGHQMSETLHVANGHAQAGFAHAWRAFMAAEIDTAVQAHAAQVGGIDEALLQVLEQFDALTRQQPEAAGIATAAGASDADDAVAPWAQDAQRWSQAARRLATGTAHAGPPQQQARAQFAAQMCTSLAQPGVLWQVSLLYSDAVIRAQQAQRSVRESLQAVLREEYFEVDAEWRLELHRPILLPSLSVDT